MSRKIGSALGALAVLMASADPVLAQTSPPEALSIRVTGDATLTVKPDEAQIDVGVTAQADTSGAATRRNAQQASTLIASLRAGMGANATVETISYTVTPDYRYPREGAEPTIAGYTAANIIRVTLHDLSRVGDVIDLATKAGANRIHRVRFTLEDDETARANALRAAAAVARARAEALAGALGVRIMRVLSASAGDERVARPFSDATLLRAEAASATPILPGTIDVHANVTLTVAIATLAPAP